VACGLRFTRSGARFRLGPASRLAALALFICGCCASIPCAAGLPAAEIAGSVHDDAGAPVAGARVVEEKSGLMARTDASGAFVLRGVGAGAAQLIVEIPGRERFERQVAAAERSGPIAIVVPAPALADAITVTAARTPRRLGDSPMSVVILDDQEIAASAAPAVDDILRQVAGFSLFRRTGGRFANPTTQGVALRGLSASGASRAVVLEDGVGINDPFGSWVYWGRVLRISLERIEVLRGAASDLYGSGAMAGVIQLVTRRAAGPAVLAEGSYGDERSGDASVFAAARRQDWGATVAGESYGTGGYVATAPALRGPVDTAVRSRFDSAQETVERQPDDGRTRLFVRAGYYGESRGNGTPLQNNATEIRQWSVGGDWQPPDGSLSCRLQESSQGFSQAFSAVAPNRQGESLTSTQTVPARSAGLSLQASRALSSGQALVGGVDLGGVSAQDRETMFLHGRSAAPTQVAGRQRTGGIFLEDLISATQRFSLTLGLRGELWRNAGERTDAAVMTRLPDRQQTALSPRLGLVFRATERLLLTASGYRAFRAPTLNELYRTFRTGNTVTEANPGLDAERLRGGEIGALWSGANGRLSVRSDLFWVEVDRPVANVTLAVTPALITRQRENLGRTRSRGAEAELNAHLGGGLTLWAGGALTDARVVQFAAASALVGKQLPEAPRVTATLGLLYDRTPLGTLGLQMSDLGAQFDDDLNQLRLRSAFRVDATATHSFPHGIALFVAGENLFDQRPEVARTPLLTLGAPRLLRLGVRYSGPGPR
jgi:outer membrane receptor protein involved in Fe transport